MLTNGNGLFITTPALRPEMRIDTELYNPEDDSIHSCEPPDDAHYHLRSKEEFTMKGAGEVSSSHPPPDEDPGISFPSGMYTTQQKQPGTDFSSD